MNNQASTQETAKHAEQSREIESGGEEEEGGTEGGRERETEKCV